MATSLQWQPPAPYDSGRNPTVTLNDDGVVVEIHQSQDALVSRVGKLDGNGITFGAPKRFDSGAFPSVSLTTHGYPGMKYAVVTYMTSRGLRYRFGNVDSLQLVMSWYPGVDQGAGTFPSVAAAPEGVVQVYQSDSIVLLYRVGYFDGNRIDFGETRQYVFGTHPRIAVNANADFVEVHVEYTAINPAMYGNRGKVDWNNRGLQFPNPESFEVLDAQFTETSIALADTGRVLVTDLARPSASPPAIPHPLEAREGQLIDKGYLLNGRVQNLGLAVSGQAAISPNGNTGVAVIQAVDDTLYYAVGTRG